MALGGLLFLAGGAVYAAAGAAGDPFTDMEPLALTFRLVKSLDGLLWVIAILGLLLGLKPVPRPEAPNITAVPAPTGG